MRSRDVVWIYEFPKKAPANGKTAKKRRKSGKCFRKMSLHTAGPTSPWASEGECDIFFHFQRGVYFTEMQSLFWRGLF